MNTSNSFNADRLFGVAAFIISPFLVYIYEANLIREQAEQTRIQQYASVLPYLEIWNSRPKNGDCKLILINNGIGPAFIREVKIRYKGKAYEGDHVDFHRSRIYPKDTTFLFTSSNVRAGRVIPAGQQVELILIEGNPANEKKAFELYGQQEAVLEIVYASVYDEKWKIAGMDGAPQKLE